MDEEQAIINIHSTDIDFIIIFGLNLFLISVIKLYSIKNSLI